MGPYVFAKAHSTGPVHLEDFMPSRMGRKKKPKSGQELMAAFIAAGARVEQRKK
jgi:hypothetical protein